MMSLTVNFFPVIYKSHLLIYYFMICNVLTNTVARKVSRLFRYKMCKVLDIFTIELLKKINYF